MPLRLSRRSCECHFHLFSSLPHFEILSPTRNDRDDTINRNDAYYLSELIYLGRIYDFETENEHLVTGFQQFLDLVGTNDKSNVTASMSFASIITRVAKVSRIPFKIPNIFNSS